MYRYLILTIFVSLLLSCSLEKRIPRQYEGEGRDKVLLEMGEPAKVVTLDNGNERLIYVKETVVKETTIGTGSFTLDQRIAPAFVREETWRFDINSRGMVEKASYEKQHK